MREKINYKVRDKSGSKNSDHFERSEKSHNTKSDRHNDQWDSSPHKGVQKDRVK